MVHYVNSRNIMSLNIDFKEFSYIDASILKKLSLVISMPQMFGASFLNA